MSAPIVIFYHTCISGPRVERFHAFNILNEQLSSMSRSGVLDKAKWFFVSVNGPVKDAKVVERVALNFGAKNLLVTPNDECDWGSDEVPTLRQLDVIAEVYPESYMLYLHMKGLGHPPPSSYHDFAKSWRGRMQDVVVDRWRECVKHLDNGFDSVGQWWNKAPNGEYWAGNFWWATSKFINTLPPIDVSGQHRGGRYEAELWIGRGPALPKYKSL